MCKDNDNIKQFIKENDNTKRDLKKNFGETYKQKKQKIYYIKLIVKLIKKVL